MRTTGVLPRKCLKGEFSQTPEFKRPCARIDDEGRLLWEAQQFRPSPAAAQACHLENPSRAKDGSDSHDNNRSTKSGGAGAKPGSGL